MSERVEQLPLPCLNLGEGPYWLEDQEALLLVDASPKRMLKYYTNTKRTQVLHVDGGDGEKNISWGIPVEGEADLLVVALDNTLSALHWAPSDPDIHTAKPMTLHTTKDYQINDGKCDPQGRLWAGSMAKINGKIVSFNPHTSHLFKYDHDLTLTTWVNNVTLSNGMAWSNDRKHFYFADSLPGIIYHFDYDDTEGTISGQRVLLDFEAAGLSGQLPDGMTIDQDDNLWVASVFGGQVLCVDPRKQEVVRRVALPVEGVTSVCWGGKDYATLYVTSGKLEERSAPHPSAGGTFAITGLGTRGSPPVTFKPDLNKLRSKLKSKLNL